MKNVLLQNVEFRFYLITRFLMTFGVQMQNLIIGWHLYKLTNDPLVLGLIGLAEAIPAISAALFAGHYVDKWDKQKVLLYSFYGYLFCSISFMLLSTSIFEQTLGTSSTILFYYLFLIILGFARSFAAPASFSIIRYLFTKEQMPKASPLSSTAWQFGAIFGPTMGGFIYAYFGATIAFLIVCFFTLCALAACTFIDSKPPILSVNEEKENIWQSIGAGLKYVFNNKIVLSAISLDLFAVLFGGAIALLPAFADKILHVGSQELGYLRAAPSIGATLILLVLSVKPPESKTGLKLLLSVGAFGLCMIGFAFSRNMWISFLLLLASGAFDAVSVVIRGTILQIFTPDEMRGRVSAVNSIFIGSSNEIGAFESGATARLFGLVPSVVMGGCMTLIIVFLAYFKSPKLRDLELKKIGSKD